MGDYKRFPRVGTVCVFNPTGLLDRGDQARGRLPASGTLVRVTQPYGCPKNGTMRMGYIEDAATGAFYGLCCQASLEKKGKVAA